MDSRKKKKPVFMLATSKSDAQSEDEPKIERKRQLRSDAVLLQEGFPKSDLDLNVVPTSVVSTEEEQGAPPMIVVTEGNTLETVVTAPVMVITRGNGEEGATLETVDPEASDGIIAEGDIVKISNIPDNATPTTTSNIETGGLQVDESVDTYTTISVIQQTEDIEHDGENVDRNEPITTANTTTSVVDDGQMNLGLVDVNKMNIQELELLENGEEVEQTTYMMVQEEETGDAVENHEEKAETKMILEDEQPKAPSSGPMLSLSSMVRVSAMEHFANNLQPDIRRQLKTGDDYDAIWKCDDGTFKVHKFVLAASSVYFKEMMNEDDSICVIQTPGLRKELVHAMLCLFYCGKVLVNWELLNEVNNAFKIVGFCGNNLTATPQDKDDESLELDYKPIRATVSHTPTKVRAPKPVKVVKKAVARKSVMDEFLMPPPIDDFEEQIEQENALLGDFIDSGDEYVPPTQANIDDSSDEIDESADFEDDYHPKKQAKKAGLNQVVTKSKRGRKRKKNVRYDPDAVLTFVDKPEVKQSKEPYDTIATYTLKTRGRGELSQNLQYDLFDDAEGIKDVSAISVCLACLAYFPEYEKLKEHKVKVHSKKRLIAADYSSEILGDDKYKCPKCENTLSLKHVVWYLKHKKYCGVDDERANNLLAPEEFEEYITKVKLKEESVVFTVSDKGRNAHEMSRFFFNKDVSNIWGCRTCYDVFSTQMEYEKHKAEVHQGLQKAGSCYSPETGYYTCMHCNTYKTRRHLVHFIYHLKRCMCDPSMGSNENDDEGLDEDNSVDVVDPWGVVNKPFRVVNDKAKWICEALFGRYIPILYPCHICYTVFEFEDDLKDHFRVSHPGQENCVDNGPHYDRERELFTCPVCKREVCHKQKSAVYFAYHLRKCSGDVHPVSRSCPRCNETFTSFRPYMFHTKNNCETKDFMCHICSQSFKDVKYLASHLSYVHSNVRPYQCTKCDKSYKRMPELRMHMQTHQETMEYSCEKCGKAFHRKRNLKIHMTTHLSEAEKRYACHLCSHRFSKKAFLVNHLTTHSSFRRFSCEICGSQVKTRDSLKQHRKRVHKLNTPIPQSCILQHGSEMEIERLANAATTTTLVVKEETVIEDFQF